MSDFIINIPMVRVVNFNNGIMVIDHRAFEIGKQSFVYGYLVVEKVEDKFVFKIVDNGVFKAVVKETIGECTRLSDSNNTMLYTNDIIASECGISVVGYNIASASYCAIDVSEWDGSEDPFQDLHNCKWFNNDIEEFTIIDSTCINKLKLIK